jgi:hypothetical protein
MYLPVVQRILGFRFRTGSQSAHICYQPLESYSNSAVAAASGDAPSHLCLLLPYQADNT